MNLINLTGNTKRAALLTTVIGAILAAPPFAQADHNRARRYDPRVQPVNARPHDRIWYSRPDVDIDSLDARLRGGWGRWHLSVAYEVETEDAAPGQFDLIIRITHRGRLLLDRTGRPITFVVHLDRPTEADDDELTYEGRFTGPLPLGPYVHPKHLKIQAQVIDRQTNRPLDHKHKSVKFKH